MTLRDVDIRTALVIPDSNDGVESILRLQKPTDESDWYSFAVESLADGVWTVHCEGKISAVYTSASSERTPVAEAALTQRVSGKRWYNAFDRVGFYYGKTFQQLQFARTDRSVRHAAGDVTVQESSGVMQGESRYLIHPSTVDACLQLIIISIHAGKHKEMPWGVVPTRIEEVSLFPSRQNASSTGHAVAWTDGRKERTFDTHVHLTGSDGRPLLQIKNLTCIIYDAAIPAGVLEKRRGVGPFSVISWKPDIKTLTPDVFERLWPTISCCPERLGKLVELVSHTRPVSTVLICGSPAQETVDAALNVLPISTTIILGYDGEPGMRLSEEAESRTTVKSLPAAPQDWVQATNGPHDLVLVDYPRHQPLNLTDVLMALTKDNGWLLGFSRGLSPLPYGSTQLGEQFLLVKTEASTKNMIQDGTTLNGITPNGTILSSKIPHNDNITIISLQGNQNLRETLAASSLDYIFHDIRINSFLPTKDYGVVIDDMAGTLFTSMSSDASVFEAVKTVLISGVRTLWLTRGVKQGTSASAGMAEGLLRVMRSEQAAARVVLLDIDSDETPQDMGKAIISKLETADTKDSGQDTEFWLHKGILHVSRVYPEESLNSKDGLAQEKPLPEGLPLTAEIADSQLVFKPLPQRSVMPDEVEVQVLASELPLSAPGPQLLLCGTIIRVGSSVDRSLVGRRVISFGYDELEAVVNTSTFTVIEEDEDVSPEALLRTLSALYPIVNLDLIGTNLAQGDYVLSLPGPKPFMSMIGRLAKAAGWKLDVVAHSSKERDQYVSQLGFSPEQVLFCKNAESVSARIREQCEKSHSGTTTVIAHDFSLLSKEVWRRIPAFCRFLLSETSVDVAPDSLPFTRGASFIATSLRAVKPSSYSARELLKRSVEVLQTYPDLSIGSSYDSIKVIDIANANNLIHYPERQSEGTIVRFGYGESRVKVTTSLFPLLSILLTPYALGTPGDQAAALFGLRDLSPGWLLGRTRTKPDKMDE